MAIAIIAGEAKGAIIFSQRVFSGNCPVNQEVIPGQPTIVKSTPKPINNRLRHHKTPVRTTLYFGGMRGDKDLPISLPGNRLNPPSESTSIMSPSCQSGLCCRHAANVCGPCQLALCVSTTPTAPPKLRAGPLQDRPWSRADARRRLGTLARSPLRGSPRIS